MTSSLLDFDAFAISLSFCGVSDTYVNDRRQNINTKEGGGLWTDSTKHIFVILEVVKGTCQDGEGSSR